MKSQTPYKIALKKNFQLQFEIQQVQENNVICEIEE